MIIKLIVLRDPCAVSDPVCWTMEAWDEYTIDENPSGFEESLQKAYEQNGAQNVRVLDVEIPDGSLSKCFEAPTVEGKVV